MTKSELHPRNRHRDGYDFPKLIVSSPELARFVRPNPYGTESIDFADPAAVKALNRALLADLYGIQKWDIPDGYLCPPVPGRADLIHEVADLLATRNGAVIPEGPGVKVLDIGTGANLIYPLIGQREYGWSFVAVDCDSKALDSAQLILNANRGIEDSIELRLQSDPERILDGVIRPGEYFDIVICNPPFYGSLEEAQAESRMKWRKLGKRESSGSKPVRNFGGQNAELWYPGGEVEFVGRMIRESHRFSKQCGLFSSLVSKEFHLRTLFGELEALGNAEATLVEMAQGQKRTRALVWMFT